MKTVKVRDYRRAASYFLSLVLLTGQMSLFAVAYAQSQSYVRGGAGVSRLPLGVMAFDSPSFGMVTDAINLASGSLFVDSFTATHNSVLTERDDRQNFFADWNLAPKMRLEGFNPEWATAPDGISVASGDSSRLSYRKVERASIDWGSVPTWIARYQSDAKAVLYRSRLEKASQSTESWVVVQPIETRYIAHLYQSDGTRVTFFKDGEFADYLQDLSQQYRSAKAGDVHGLSTTAPRTEMTYLDAKEGQLSEIRDEYGRTTKLFWDQSRGLLNEVRQLVTDGKQNGQNQIKFSYDNFNGQNALTQVTFVTDDGYGQQSSRWMKMEYQSSGGRLLVKKLLRQSLDSNETLTTTYDYDAQNRLTKVAETGLPDTVYNYVTSAGGQKVEVTQGNKLQTYQFNSAMQLEARTQLDRNPDGQEKVLTWKYTYDEAGRTRSVVEPTGLTTVLSYDERGNVKQVDEFDQPIGIPATLPPADPQNPEPQQGLPSQNPRPGSAPIGPELPPAGEVKFTVQLKQRPQTLGSGAQCQFTAELIPSAGGRLPADQSVTWKAVRGKITDKGLYTAPDLAWGRPVQPLQTEDTVTVTSIADPTKTDEVKFKIGRLGEPCAVGPQAVAVTGTRQLAAQNLDGVQAGDRSYQYQYDRDNRLTLEVTPERSGTKDNTPYHSGEVRVQSEYLDFTVVAQEQQFNTTKQVTQTTFLGGKEQKKTVVSLDEQGRTTALERLSGEHKLNYTLTYADGSPVSVAYPDVQGHAGSTRPVPQYGDLVRTVTRHDGFTTEFTYDEWGHAALIRERGAYQGTKGAEDRLTYQGFSGYGDQVWSTVVGEGKYSDTLLAQYYSTGALKSFWEGNPSNLTQYTYFTTGKDLGRPQTITSGLNGRNSTVYTYDEFGRVLTATENGGTYTFKYDTLDRTAEYTTPSQAVTRYHYDLSQEVSEVARQEPKRGLNQVTTIKRDSRGLPSVISDGLGVQTLTYDPQGRLIRLNDTHLDMNAEGEDQSRYYAYDGLGRLTAEIGPALNTKEQMGTATDARRPMKLYTYDGLGQVTLREELVDGRVSVADLYQRPAAQFKVSRMEYSNEGHLRKLTSPSGAQMTVQSDAVGQPVKLSTDIGTGIAVQQFAYDAQGNTVRHTDALNRVRRATFDEVGNKTSVINAEGNIEIGYTFTPDYLPLGTYRPDPNAKATASVFGGAGTSGMVPEYLYEYGAKTDHPVAASKASKDGLVRVPMQYDMEGNLLSQTLPGGQKEDFVYDGWGNLVQSKNSAGVTIQRSYDEHGRLTSQSWSRSNAEDTKSGLTNFTEKYTYNAADQLIRSQRGAMAAQYAYNSLDKLIAETPEQRGGGLKNLKQYRWRPDGRLVLSTTAGFAGTLPDTLENPDADKSVSVTSGLVSVFGLDAAGRVVTNASYGKGGREAITRYTYNGLDLPLTRDFLGDSRVYGVQRSASGAELGTDLKTAYTYDLAGQLLTAVDTAKDGTVVSSHEFGYTPDGREASRKNVHSFKGNMALGGAPLTVGEQDLQVISQYGARGSLSEVTIQSDGKIIKNSIAYYLDGSRKSVKAGEVGSLGRTLSYDYDWRGRVTGTTVTNDATGNQAAGAIAYTDSGGYTKNVSGKTKREVTLNALGLVQNVKVYVPGPSGSLELGSDHTFQYNESAQPIRQDVTQYYWKQGNSSSYKDTTYGTTKLTYTTSYDDLGNPLEEKVTLPKEFAELTGYCKSGVSCTESGALVTATSGKWAYDSTGHLSREEVNAPAAVTSNRTVTYQRSASGMMTGSTGVYYNNATYSSMDGAVVRYSPDGQMSSVDRKYRTADNRRVMARFGYDPMGQKTYDVNTIVRETQGTPVVYDIDRDQHEYAYSGAERVGVRSSTSSEGNTPEWGRTAAQNGQELMREDRWRDMTYSMMDGIGDDRTGYSYHFAPRDFEQYPNAAPAASGISPQAQSLNDLNPVPTARGAEGNVLPTSLAPTTLPEGAEVIHPLGWGQPFVTAGGEAGPLAQPHALSTVPASPEAELADQQLSSLALPNGGLSSTLNIAPEGVQAPQNLGLANGGRPSDDLTFEGALSAQNGDPISTGVLGVRAPNAASDPLLSAAPGGLPIDDILAQGGPISQAPGPGACGPDGPPGGPDGPGNPYPCPDPYGAGPSGPPDDPENLECMCGHSPNFNPDAPPVLRYGATMTSAAVESFTDGIDGIKDLGFMAAAYSPLGGMANAGLAMAQFVHGRPPEEIEWNMGSKAIMQVSGSVSLTSGKRWAEKVLGVDQYIDRCGAMYRNTKLGVDIASFVIPGVGALKVASKAGRLGGLARGLPRLIDEVPFRPNRVREGTPEPRPVKQQPTGCPINSFAAETEVKVITRDEKGQAVETSKPIGEMKEGDLVYSYDELTGTLGYFPVGAIIVNDDEAITYVTISSSDEQAKGQSPSTEVITTTPNHPFYLEAQVDSAKRPKLTDHVGLLTPA